MIKAVVFDWGGVLIDEPTICMMTYFSKKLGVNVRDLKEVLLPLIEEFQKGISEKDLWEKTCETLRIPLFPQKTLWSDALSACFVWRNEVISLANKLKENGYILGFLSNTECPSVEYFHKSNVISFDVTIFSCVEKLVKPQKEIYELLLQKLGTFADETVFIDDKKIFCEGARKVGIHGIEFKSIEQVKDELKKMGLKF